VTWSPNQLIADTPGRCGGLRRMPAQTSATTSMPLPPTACSTRLGLTPASAIPMCFAHVSPFAPRRQELDRTRWPVRIL